MNLQLKIGCDVKNCFKESTSVYNLSKKLNKIRKTWSKSGVKDDNKVLVSWQAKRQIY